MRAIAIPAWIFVLGCAAVAAGAETVPGLKLLGAPVPAVTITADKDGTIITIAGPGIGKNGRGAT